MFSQTNPCQINTVLSLGESFYVSVPVKLKRTLLIQLTVMEYGTHPLTKKLNKIDFGGKKALSRLQSFTLHRWYARQKNRPQLLFNCCSGFNRRLAPKEQNHHLSPYHHLNTLELYGKISITAIRAGFGSKVGDSIMFFVLWYQVFRVLEDL